MGCKSENFGLAVNTGRIDGKNGGSGLCPGPDALASCAVTV